MLRFSMLMLLLAASTASAGEVFEGTLQATPPVFRPEIFEPNGLVLIGKDGSVKAIAKTGVTALLFAEPALRGRTLRLTAVIEKDKLAVESVRIIKDGKTHELYYWCDNCQLRANEPGPCLCCGGETRLVEEVKP